SLFAVHARWTATVRKYEEKVQVKIRRSPSLVKRQGPTRTALGIPSSAQRARNLIVCWQKRGFIVTTLTSSTSSIADHQTTIWDHLKAKKLSHVVSRGLKKKWLRFTSLECELLFLSARIRRVRWISRGQYTKFVGRFTKSMTLGPSLPSIHRTSFEVSGLKSPP